MPLFEKWTICIRCVFIWVSMEDFFRLFCLISYKSPLSFGKVSLWMPTRSFLLYFSPITLHRMHMPCTHIFPRTHISENLTPWPFWFGKLYYPLLNLNIPASCGLSLVTFGNWNQYQFPNMTTFPWSRVAEASFDGLDHPNHFFLLYLFWT